MTTRMIARARQPRHQLPLLPLRVRQVVESRDGFIEANGLRFHYLEWGEAGAPALCLFHGFGNQAHIWDLCAPVLAGRYHIYAFDSRGHGDTDYASDYGVEFNAADARALIDELGLERLSLIGFSMGGITTIHFASDQPGRVERLVLVDVGPEVNPAGARGMRATVAQAQSRFPAVKRLWPISAWPTPGAPKS